MQAAAGGGGVVVVVTVVITESNDMFLAVELTASQLLWSHRIVHETISLVCSFE